MVDPAGTTIGAIGLLYPLFEACERLYRGYQISHAFGHDFMVIKLGLEALHARLQRIAKRRLRDLKDHQQMDVDDQNDPTLSVVLRYLATVKRDFEECSALMEHYQKKGNLISFISSVLPLLPILQLISHLSR